MKRFLVSFNYNGKSYAEITYANTEEGAIDIVGEKLVEFAERDCGESSTDIINNISKENFTVEEVQ